jgi:hypothetical protein
VNTIAITAIQAQADADTSAPASSEKEGTTA